MKAKALLAKLGLFLDGTNQIRKREFNALRKLLKQLKDKEQDWKKKLKTLPEGEEYVELEEKITIIHIQRQKGIERLQALKLEQKNTRDN